MANRIKQLREENRMTQVRLSIELEVSQETVSAYEKEKHYPSFAQLCKMSDLFHVSIDYLMGLSDIRTPVKIIENELLSQLIAAAKALTEPQLELVLAYVQGLTDAAAKL